MTRLANGIANCYDCYRTGNDFFGENYDENLVLFWNGSIDDTIGDSYIQFHIRIYSERLRLRLRLESRLRLELRLLRSLLDIDTTSLLYLAILSQSNKNETPTYENKQRNSKKPSPKQTKGTACGLPTSTDAKQRFPGAARAIETAWNEGSRCSRFAANPSSSDCTQAQTENGKADPAPESSCTASCRWAATSQRFLSFTFAKITILL